MAIAIRFNFLHSLLKLSFKCLFLPIFISYFITCSVIYVIKLRCFNICYSRYRSDKYNRPSLLKVYVTNKGQVKDFEPIHG